MQTGSGGTLTRPSSSQPPLAGPSNKRTAVVTNRQSVTMGASACVFEQLPARVHDDCGTQQHRAALSDEHAALCLPLADCSSHHLLDNEYYKASYTHVHHARTARRPHGQHLRQQPLRNSGLHTPKTQVSLVTRCISGVPLAARRRSIARSASMCMMVAPDKRDCTTSCLGMRWVVSQP